MAISDTALTSNPNTVYLGLLELCLLGTIYSETEEYQRVQFRRGSWQARVYAPLGKLLALKSYYLHKRVPIFHNGVSWPAQGLTMIGRNGLKNIEECLASVLRSNVPGDVIECGVWRGGAAIFMKAILRLAGSDKQLFVADSFCGVPKPNPRLYPADAEEERKDAFYKYDQLAVPLEEVQANFRRFGLLDDQVHFLKGWFKDTLPVAPIKRLSLIRLDGDLYESTWNALVPLYPMLSPGGFCIIDDYGGIPACRKAVEDYRKMAGIREPIVEVDSSRVFWQRA